MLVGDDSRGFGKEKSGYSEERCLDPGYVKPRLPPFTISGSVNLLIRNERCNGHMPADSNISAGLVATEGSGRLDFRRSD